jgi:hypothetical protein
MTRIPEIPNQENFTKLGPRSDQVSNESLLMINGLSLLTRDGKNYIRDESTGLILTDGFQNYQIFQDEEDDQTISRIVGQIGEYKRDLIPSTDFYDVLGDGLSREKLIRKKLLIGKLFPESDGFDSRLYRGYSAMLRENPLFNEEPFSSEQLRIALTLIFDCNPEQISLSESEIAKGDIKFHYGDFHLTNLNQEQPQKMSGTFYFDGKTFNDLVLSDIVGGCVVFKYTEVFRSLILPRKVGGYVNLNKAKTFEKLIFPDYVGNVVYLDSLSPEEIYKLKKPSDVEIDMR